MPFLLVIFTPAFSILFTSPWRVICDLVWGCLCPGVLVRRSCFAAVGDTPLCPPRPLLLGRVRRFRRRWRGLSGFFPLLPASALGVGPCPGRGLLQFRPALCDKPSARMGCISFVLCIHIVFEFHRKLTNSSHKERGTTLALDLKCWAIRPKNRNNKNRSLTLANCTRTSCGPTSWTSSMVAADAQLR